MGRTPHRGVKERRQVIRLLVQQVVVWPSASSQELTVQVHWSGGTVTEHPVIRTVKSWEQVADAEAVRQRVQRGRAEGRASGVVAAEWNAAGYRTPRACRSRPRASDNCGRGWAGVRPRPPRRPPDGSRTGESRGLRSREHGGLPGPGLTNRGWPRRGLAAALVLSRKPSINYTLVQSFNPSKSL